MPAPRFLGKPFRLHLWAPGVFLLLLLNIWAITSLAGTTPAGPSAPETKAAAMDQQMLEEVVNKALERHLAPVKEMLAELIIHRTSLTDIIGGLGYILGIFGIWAYFLSKKKKDS